MTENNWKPITLAPKDGTVIQGKMFTGWRKDGRPAALTRNTWYVHRPGSAGHWHSSKGKWEPTLWQPAAKSEINRSKYA